MPRIENPLVSEHKSRAVPLWRKTLLAEWGDHDHEYDHEPDLITSASTHPLMLLIVLVIVILLTFVTVIMLALSFRPSSVCAVETGASPPFADPNATEAD